MIFHSALVNFPFLNRILSGMAILPISCNNDPTRIPSCSSSGAPTLFARTIPHFGDTFGVCFRFVIAANITTQPPLQDCSCIFSVWGAVLLLTVLGSWVSSKAGLNFLSTSLLCCGPCFLKHTPPDLVLITTYRVYCSHSLEWLTPMLMDTRIWNPLIVWNTLGIPGEFFLPA